MALRRKIGRKLAAISLGLQGFEKASEGEHSSRGSAAFVEEENGAGTQVDLDAADDLRGRGRATVAACCTPSHDAESVPLSGWMDREIVHTDRRAKPDRASSCRGQDGFVAACDFAFHQRCGESPPMGGRVGIGVVAEEMAVREDAAAEGAVTVDFFADDEKNRSRLMPGEKIEDLRGVARVRTIVDRETNFSFRGVEAGDNGAMPLAIATQGGCQPEKIVEQTGERPGPSPQGQRTRGGGEPSGGEKVSGRECHCLRSFQTCQRRGSNKRHNRVCVPTRRRLSRR